MAQYRFFGFYINTDNPKEINYLENNLDNIKKAFQLQMNSIRYDNIDDINIPLNFTKDVLLRVNYNSKLTITGALNNKTLLLYLTNRKGAILDNQLNFQEFKRLMSMFDKIETVMRNNVDKQRKEMGLKSINHAENMKIYNRI